MFGSVRGDRPRGKAEGMFLVIVLVLIPAEATASEALPSDESAAPLNGVEILSPSFDDGSSAIEGERSSLLRRIRGDLVDLATAPVRMNREDWLRFSAALAAVGAAAMLDDEIDAAVRQDRDPETLAFAESIRPLGQEGGLLALGLFYAAGHWQGDERWSAVGRDGFEAVLVSAGLVTPLLKSLSGRSRPRHSDDMAFRFGGGESFPSGEVTQTFTIAAVIAAHSESRWIDVIAWTAAGLIGWQRMRLDAHWFSDVIAGAVIGATVGNWIVRRNRGSRAARGWIVQPVVAPKGGGLSVRVRF